MDEETDLLDRLAATDDVEERVEILAVMSKRGFRAPTRGQGGQRKRFMPRAPNGGQTGAREVPPRGRQDIVCINCGRKGHAASECRQPKVEKNERPCFNCGKKGHIAKECIEKSVCQSKPLMLLMK